MKKIPGLLVFTFLLTTSFAQNTILWSIQKPGSPQTSYVLGTFHQTGNSFVDGKPVIKELLLQSDIVIFESVEDKYEKVINVMLQRPDDFSYREFLLKEDLEFLEKFSKYWKVPVSKQKPAELLVKLQQEYVKMNCGGVKPTDTTSHMDDYLLSLARNNNVRTEGLESFADQFEAINSINGEDFTWEKAKDAVHVWVSNFQDDKNQSEICGLTQAYLKLRLDYQFNAKCAENDPILLKRNEKWMPLIKDFIQQNNSLMIIVGLYHLYGECGIISQLRKDGYTVKPVKLK
ncbi:TraB/GumN family protein [Fluviicola sp.]|uniref:TraB/GumN family protein n=1 Tax=Fluviicola sp. TaxID=1917219 RepID=UPI0031D61267